MRTFCLPAGRTPPGRHIDPEHGPRAADYAAWLRRKGYFELDDAAFALLHEACWGHSDGLVEAAPTIQVCWDSDRLDLSRVGISYLCADERRKPERIAAAMAWSGEWREA